MPQPTVQRAAYKPHEFAQLFGVTRETVYVWIRSGIITSARVGGSRLIPASEVARLLEGGADERAS